MSEKTSKCFKNISSTLGYGLVCYFFVLATFWRHLWSITEQTQGIVKYILYYTTCNKYHQISPPGPAIVKGGSPCLVRSMAVVATLMNPISYLTMNLCKDSESLLCSHRVTRSKAVHDELKTRKSTRTSKLLMFVKLLLPGCFT